jgi:hypothetical protein
MAKVQVQEEWLEQFDARVGCLSEALLDHVQEALELGLVDLAHVLIGLSAVVGKRRSYEKVDR